MDNNTKLIAEAKEAVEEWSSLWTTFVTPEAPRRLVTELRLALEAAEAELTRRDTVQALHEEGDRVVLSSAIGAVVWNASNHPKPSAVLGQDIGPLRSKLVDAVIAAGFTHAAPVSLEAVKAETTTEWNAVRQDATGELWDVYEPFDSREDAERVAAEWRGNNEPGDDPVVVVERTKGVAPGEWQIVSSEVNRV
ncbi:hypothetical protein A4X17_11360 [Plantibacter sp. H53]|uniref:hypothetical protein n=1 Tax=Plantibacter sp. H53 TaxID=1827323 RepID=UPI0007D9B298|nr:hypothetical protein [Plantibacter sp. H53]OAN35072.1 hypothetical protein A4X17_11360 [Plantibacter sp. H53]